MNLGVAIKSVSFNSSNPRLYNSFRQLLTGENFALPEDVAKSVVSLLKQDPRIQDLLLKKNSAVGLNETISIIRILDEFVLLHHLMRVCPLPEPKFGELFVTMRSSLLRNQEKMVSSPELIYFLSTLSIHCFTNEYVYIEGDEETHSIDELQTRISQTPAQSEPPRVAEVLCLASYRPLH